MYVMGVIVDAKCYVKTTKVDQKKDSKSVKVLPSLNLGIVNTVVLNSSSSGPRLLQFLILDVSASSPSS
ncbi:hypothetical protein Y032_0124g1235 [Ancylostoma ceylanicum]|uniref:Uncharacterized protein n=1 Tax=Ancylostoma ceylanicum TaxID=53326 RepID=A0A016T9D6_9BILA|nr:hypothetical protein Y032_0124g1235 [Ancylostoma ceylanicum]